MLCFCDILICHNNCQCMILIPMILVGSPISIVSHLVCMSFFIFSMLFAESAKSRRLSTQMVIIAVLLSLEQVYTHGLVHKHFYPFCLIFVSNSAFHLWLDCLSPYRDFIK
jgi:hypothetical protein